MAQTTMETTDDGAAAPRSPDRPAPNVAASYDGSTATYRLLRAFNWGPALMNLGYFPFRGLLRPLNFLCSLSEAQRRLVGKSVGMLDPRDGQSVLDIACGRGETSFMIAQRIPHGRVVGVDYLARNVTAAQTLFTGLSNLEYRQGDAMSLDFPDASFDRVHCLEAAFHFADRPKFLRECARVLKPGGRLVVVDVVWKSIAARAAANPAHVDVIRGVWQFDDLYSREEYVASAAAAGFADVVVRDWTRGVTDPIVSLMRSALWLARRSWGRKLLLGFNSQVAVVTDDDWRELERTADAYREQQRLGAYMAFTAEKR